MIEMKRNIQKVIDKYSFSQKEAGEILNCMVAGDASKAQIAAYLTSMNLRGEEITDISGMALALRKHVIKVKSTVKNIVDICGTGGDLINTFNISTLAAFVAAGAGVKIAKHGNRAISSNCGSADLLEKLGVVIDLPANAVAKCIKELGIGFLYTPGYFPILKNIEEVRKEIGIRTIFNIIIPLINPVNLDGIIVGVYEERLTTIVANVLRNLGIKNAYVVHGIEGSDEISLTGPTRVSELRKGSINTYTITPEDFGMHSVSISTLLGGNAAENAKTAKTILSGTEQSPRTDVVLLNAAAAIAVSGKVASLQEGLTLAQRSLYSGEAAKKLEDLIVLTQKLARKNKRISVKKTVAKKTVKKKVKKIKKTKKVKKKK
jgi:anthranilate phosphoribosyltransferase